eukprot:CAMPEP_0198296188 /NCGR_PEP_ID=MMETSP1449-20131203/31389_1 /TAXON_ID=420275 /ORGANISM="Attheya septentrionalis, Strain CCMP2084" /LENGTH=261 /DNA_ID=CAMNT_0043996725 /DNA_START=36 /DNA_END=821 /DNA_ORIENTATION=+
MGWFSSDDDKSSSSSKSGHSVWDSIASNEYIQLTPETSSTIKELIDFNSGQLALIGIGCATCFAIGFKSGRMRPSWQRITSVNDIPAELIGPKAPSLRGKVVSVSDGDTLRFLHTPTIFHSSKVPSDKKMSEVALPVRLCTIDTPEVAKFGKPGQPYGDEAKAHLQSMVLNKTITVKLLQKDQYGRVVGQVSTGRFFPKYADEKMLNAGLAEVYLGGGAVYGIRGKDAYLAMQDKAMSKKTGMWSQKNRESAAEFKARMKK